MLPEDRWGNVTFREGNKGDLPERRIVYMRYVYLLCMVVVYNGCAIERRIFFFLNTNMLFVQSVRNRYIDRHIESMPKDHIY